MLFQCKMYSMLDVCLFCPIDTDTTPPQAPDFVPIMKMFEGISVHLWQQATE